MGIKGIRGYVAFTLTIVLCLLSIIWILAAPAWGASLTNVTDSLSNNTAGVKTTHTVVFKTANDLTRDGQIVITFPAGFDLSEISLGLNLNLFTCSVSGQALILQKIFRSSISAHTTITVPLYNIGNCTVPGNYRVSVKTIDPTHLIAGEPQIIDGPTYSAYFPINAPALITLVPGVMISDKTYDKTAAAVISSRTLSGVIGSQDVSLVGGTAEFSSVNVGNNITVSVTGLSLSGADASKYVLSSTSATTSASIAARPVTVTAAADTREYNGTAGSTVVPSITSGSLASGDTAGFTQTFSSDNVGSDITLTPSGTVNDGNGGNNYTVVFIPANNGTITFRPITVTAVSDNKIYDGTTNSPLVPTITSGSLAAGDHAIWTQTFAAANTGANLVLIPAGSVNDGNGGNNYAVSLVNAENGSITPKELTLSGITAANKVYDGTTLAVLNVTGASLSGVVSGDSVSLNASNAAGVFNDKNAGANKAITISGMTLSGGSAGNYTLSSVAPTSAQITARPITVSAAASIKTYDGSTSSAGVPIIASGSLVGGDIASWSQTYSNKNAGNAKTLIPAGSVSDGNNGNNYNVSFTSVSSGNIAARTITVSAVTSSKTYDGSTSSSGSPTITGGSLAAGDSAVWAQTFATPNAGSNKILIPAGSVNDGNGGNNYTVKLVNATTGVITRATPLINWPKPTDITTGTILSVSQLNASAKRAGGLDLNGTFSYVPPAGTVLSAGSNQTLRVDFVPADTTNYNIASASVMINVSASSSGGSAGSGSGNPVPTNPPTALAGGATNLSTFVDATGVFKIKASISSSDNVCSLVIPGGTIAKTAGGNALSLISMESTWPDQETFTPSSGAIRIGSVYNLGPEGATFEPPITMSLAYDVTQLPVRTPESRLVIAYWDAGDMKWEPLDGCQVDTVMHAVKAPMTHFSLYSILVLPPAPAVFSVSQLTVSPPDLLVGQTATVSIQVSNSGEESGDYEVDLKLAGSPVETKQITVAGQSDQVITFNLTQNLPGTYEIAVNGLQGSIRVLPLAPVLLQDLIVSPAQVEPGAIVTFSATVINSNDSSVEEVIPLTVDGVIKESRSVTIPAKSQEELTFSLSLFSSGSYIIGLGGLTGMLEVAIQPVPTNTLPGVEQTPTSSAESGVIVLSDPATTAQNPLQTLASASKIPATLVYFLILVGVFILAIGTTIVVVLNRRSKI
jgi:hypothetical protein